MTKRLVTMAGPVALIFCAAGAGAQTMSPPGAVVQPLPAQAATPTDSDFQAYLASLRSKA
jgi:hypothetical protein